MVPLPLRFPEHKVILPCSLWEPGWTLGDKIHKRVGSPWWLGPPLVFTSQTCPCRIASTASVPFRFPRLVPAEACAPGKSWFYLSVGLYNFGDSSLPCDLTSLRDRRKIAEFSVCSAFFLLGRYGDFLLLPSQSGNQTRSLSSLCLSFLPLFLSFLSFLFFSSFLMAYGISQARHGMRCSCWPAYSTATATLDLSCVCDLHHSSQQCWILNPRSKARILTASWWRSRVCYCWAKMRTALSLFILTGLL